MSRRKYQTTLTEFGKAVGIAAPSVSNLVKIGAVNLNQTLEKAIPEYCQYLRDRLRGKTHTDKGDAYDAVEERARLAHHQANNEMLKEAELRGELIRISEVKRQLSERMIAFRQKMLALPTRAAAKGMGYTTVKELEDYLTEEINLALSELTSKEIKAADDETEGTVNGQSRGAAKPKRRYTKKRRASKASASIDG